MNFSEPNLTVDVIVIGYGAAGGAAAITAHDHGAETIILEKMSHGGGNSYVSSANMVFPKDPADADKFANYLNEVNFGTTEPEIVDTFVNGLLENPAWLESLGGELEINNYFKEDPSLSYYIPNKTFPGLPSAQGLEIVAQHLKQTENCPEPTGGHRIWNLLDKNIRARGIKVMVSTAVKELVKNSHGEIIGVIANSEGQEIFIKARQGVIITCGGFENNQKLKLDNLKPNQIGFLGSPGNTGDGIKMVEKIGAALWHMNAEASLLGFKPAEFDTGFAITMRKPGFIYVDKYGNRFVDETRLEAHEAAIVTSEFTPKNYSYSRLPCYLIMDEENARGKAIALQIFSYNVVVRDYQWSSDNSKEIEKGWIVKAETLSELSKLLNLDETTLAFTIGKYNNFCRNGVDSDFGRMAETLKAISPPYYAMPLMPLLYNTQGGAKRDKEARVLDANGQPIPRLFAAGEFGSIWGFRYQTSTNYSECLVFGRIAGRNVAMSEPIK
ncbi:MAG: FAD-binding protein [Crinalium sp.]